MKTILRTGILTGALCLALAVVAKADNIHLCDISTGCADTGSVIVISTAGTTGYVSGNPTGDELFLAILTPVSDTSGNWSGGSLWSVLGVPLPASGPNSSGTYPTLSSAISQESIGAGLTAMSFTASAIDTLSTWTVNGQAISMPVEPVGTIIMAFTESGGNLGLVTPWSSSLIATPEPSSLLLLVVGMGAALGVMLLKARA
jgi:hypothetical protein